MQEKKKGKMKQSTSVRTFFKKTKMSPTRAHWIPSARNSPSNIWAAVKNDLH